MPKPLKIDGVDVMVAFLGEDWETNPTIATELSGQFGPDWKSVMIRKVHQYYNDYFRNQKIDTSKRTSFHLTPKHQQAIIKEYQKLTPVQSLAERYHVSKAAIYKILKRHGIETNRTQFAVSCSVCGKEIMRHRARVRKQQNHFCSRVCYSAFLKAGNHANYQYRPNRYGERRGRAVVSKYFALTSSNIVHHEDGNCLNNNLWNLKVFANQGDHIRHHRGFDVIPLWDGSAV